MTMMEDYDVCLVSVIVQEFWRKDLLRFTSKNIVSNLIIGFEYHGEHMLEGALDNGGGLGMNGAHNQPQDDQFMSMKEMVYDALRHQDLFQLPNEDDKKELPNEETQRFYKLLLDTNTTLYEVKQAPQISSH